MTRDIRFLGRRFTLREALLLGFCATFIVLTRAALRLHFSLPGHSMFFLTFFLLMARGCVPKIGAATLVGVISGLVCMLLGMAKLGPLIVANFILPAMVVDLAGFAYPRMVRSYIACLLVGVIASATKGVTGILLDYLMGMDPDVVVRHVFIATIASAIFGALGAFMVPPVIRRLQANDLIPSSER
ncbi:MAG: hypothetical protein A2V77_09900 [Anaeromyxobacter sp. RBG_16_69_14]|jgi:hypothetical protein|nr:MAG: hypothetical protein A2V77_09900 [Anaeromyxobacter sp. RBG_16_69_14]